MCPYTVKSESAVQIAIQKKSYRPAKLATEEGTRPVSGLFVRFLQVKSETFFTGQRNDSVTAFANQPSYSWWRG